MKEKYVGKVKVPFCVKVDTLSTLECEILVAVFNELGVSTECITRHYDYDGANESGYNDYWNSPEEFGENTTVYTLEELQAIINNLNNIDEEIPELDLKEDSNGWIPWSGGDMPIPEGTLIDVKHRDGETYRNRPAGGSASVEWDHCGAMGDIVAYRIVGSAVALADDATATLAQDGYVGIASGETGSTDSVGSSVSVTANISFDVVIKGQSFTLTTDELQGLYIQLCGVENYFREWSLDV